MEKHKPILQTVCLFDLDSGGKQFYRFERAPYCLGYPVYSACLICPKCTQLWGSIMVERGLQDDYILWPRGVSCEGCFYMGPHRYEWSSHIPGSLLDNGIINPDGVDWAMLERMPQVLVERELRLTMKAVEKYPQAFPYF